MRGAAESFSRTLADVPFHAPTSVLFSNARDRVSDAPSARTALADQICNTVRWDECMENVAARRIGCVLEIGPGRALAHLWNQRFPGILARSCDDFRSAAAIAAWIGSNSGP
jgi:[acyl-carrier-protein] S-malonyltransferase